MRAHYCEGFSGRYRDMRRSIHQYKDIGGDYTDMAERIHDCITGGGEYGLTRVSDSCLPR